MFNQIIYLIYVKRNFLFMQETHLLHLYISEASESWWTDESLE